MKFAARGMGPGFGDNFRPGVGPKEIAPSVGGGDFNPYRPPGLIAPPSAAQPAPTTGVPAPGQGGFTHQGPGSGMAAPVQGGPQAQLPLDQNGQPPGQRPMPAQQVPGGVPANGQQAMMQRILQDPFIMRIMQAQGRPSGAGFGGTPFRQPFGGGMSNVGMRRPMMQPQIGRAASAQVR